MNLWVLKCMKNEIPNSQTGEVVVAHSSWISQLFAHCVSISATETIITHSAPLSIAVHLHQTLTGVDAPSESYHTIVWTAPETRCVYAYMY